MATRTPFIDSQVHAFERNRPERPWIAYLQGPDEVTADDTVAASGCFVPVGSRTRTGWRCGYMLCKQSRPCLSQISLPTCGWGSEFAISPMGKDG
jgi:hypothetical protein